MAPKKPSRLAAKGFKSKPSKISIEIPYETDHELSLEPKPTDDTSQTKENRSKKSQESLKLSIEVLSEKENSDDEVTRFE